MTQCVVHVSASPLIHHMTRGLHVYGLKLKRWVLRSNKGFMSFSNILHSEYTEEGKIASTCALSIELCVCTAGLVHRSAR